MKKEFHVLMRNLCIRYKGTVSGRNGRLISPIASLHESPRAVTQLPDNIRELCVTVLIHHHAFPRQQRVRFIQRTINFRTKYSVRR